MKPLHLRGRHGLSAATRADIHSRIGAIPGCGLMRLVGLDSDPGFSLAMTGWSPSLHRIEIDVSVHADPGTGEDNALGHLEQLLGLQRRRAAAGLVLGTPFPLDATLSMAMSRGELPCIPEVRHLWIDRSVMAGLVARHPTKDFDDVLLGSVIQPLSRLHDDKTNGGWHQMSGNGIAFTDERGVPEVEPTLAISRDIVANGSEIIITGRTIPDTAATLLTGEPLERLLELGNDYDGRRIEGVKPFQTHIVVDLVPDLVRLDEVMAEYRGD